MWREYFPHEQIRSNQKKIMAKIMEGLAKKQPVFINAPTGSGKTIAALAPLLAYAKEWNKKILFLTSRKTQHDIVLESIKKINATQNKAIKVLSLYARRDSCLLISERGPKKGQSTKEFNGFCKLQREEGLCQYYETYKKIKSQITHIAKKNELSHEDEMAYGSEYHICPHEMTLDLAKNKAEVIISDYNYLFSKQVRESLLSRTESTLEDYVVIVDEAHNLPARLREYLTIRIDTDLIKEFSEMVRNPVITEALQKIFSFLKRIEDEQEVDLNSVLSLHHQATVLEALDKIDDGDERQDYLKNLFHDFFDYHTTYTKGFTLIARKLKTKLNTQSLELVCLDPWLLAKEVMQSVDFIALMSATLSPLDMYAKLLGVTTYSEVECDTPFAKENKLVLIDPSVSTMYQRRTEEEFQKIAKRIVEYFQLIDGNTVVFFPSYALLNKVFLYIEGVDNLLAEQRDLSREDKQSLVNQFRMQHYKKNLLLAVASGSYGEGLDFPGELLKGVLVVGVPLAQPDLPTKALIKYYDKKFGRGTDYGYIVPAITTVLQNAGRCIRTETDRGIIIFMDHRFTMDKYKQLMPHDMQGRVSLDPRKDLKTFVQQA